jgi:uncharacterized protein
MSSNESSDGDCCCGCCVGVAIGYLLFSPNVRIQIFPENTHSETKEISDLLFETKSNNFLLNQINNYQRNISPQIKEDLGKDRLCKYTPSCSEYAKQAIEKYGSVKGSLLATKRLAKCNPFSKGGEDPLV